MVLCCNHSTESGHYLATCSILHKAVYQIGAANSYRPVQRPQMIAFDSSFLGILHLSLRLGCPPGAGEQSEGEISHRQEARKENGDRKGAWVR
jgi:hypothetical protein